MSTEHSGSHASRKRSSCKGKLAHTYRILARWRGILFPNKAFLVAALRATLVDALMVNERRGESGLNERFEGGKRQSTTKDERSEECACACEMGVLVMMLV